MGRCRVMVAVMCVFGGSAVISMSYCLRRGSRGVPQSQPISPHSAMLFLPPSPWSKGVHETVYTISYIISYILSA